MEVMEILLLVVGIFVVVASFLVPEGKTLTLELNGWVLTRNLADQKGDGAD